MACPYSSRLWTRSHCEAPEKLERSQYADIARYE
jgi:hypothetical protein